MREWNYRNGPQGDGGFGCLLIVMVIFALASLFQFIMSL